jgi:hypothetical protein
VVKNKNKKAMGHQGKPLTDTIDTSLDIKANKDPVPVVNVKNGARHWGKTGAVLLW